MTNSPHENVGAHALHALPPQESAEFNDHLASCETCSDEYNEFLETAAMLATAVAETPPAELRDKVLELAATTPQLPPLTAFHPPQDAPSTSVTPITDATGGRRQQHTTWWRRSTTLIAAAAAAIVLVTGGIVATNMRDSPSPDQIAAQCVVSAPDAEELEPTVGTGGSVTIALSCDAAVVALASMPPLPSNRGYQLWVMAGSQARSVGMVTASPSDENLIVTGLTSADTDIGISVEPVDGSPEPTTDPVWVVPIRS